MASSPLSLSLAPTTFSVLEQATELEFLAQLVWALK